MSLRREKLVRVIDTVRQERILIDSKISKMRDKLQNNKAKMEEEQRRKL